MKVKWRQETERKRCIVQASGYGAAANQPNVGFQQGGGNYSHAQSSKYQGGGGYSGQGGGLYGNQRMRGHSFLALWTFFCYSKTSPARAHQQGELCTVVSELFQAPAVSRLIVSLNIIRFPGDMSLRQLCMCRQGQRQLCTTCRVVSVWPRWLSASWSRACWPVPGMPRQTSSWHFAPAIGALCNSFCPVSRVSTIWMDGYLAPPR